MADEWDSIVDFGTATNNDEWSPVVSFDSGPAVAIAPEPAATPPDDFMAGMVARNEQLRADLRKSLGREPTNEDFYQVNLQRTAELDAEANPRNALTGSVPYRTVETAASSLKNKGLSLAAGAISTAADAVGAEGLAEGAGEVHDYAQNTATGDAASQALADKKGWMGETLTSWTRGGGSAVLESVPLAMAGGLPAVAAAFAASTFDDKVSDGASIGEATAHGIIEGAFTMLGGKLLGSGVGKLVGKIGGAEVEGLSGKVAQYLAKRFPINEAIAKVSTAAGAEAAEEFSTEVAHYLVDVANDRDKFSPERLWERAKGTIGPSLIAGGFGEGISHLSNVLQERQRELPTVTKAIKDAQVAPPEVAAKLWKNDALRMSPWAMTKEEFAKSFWFHGRAGTMPRNTVRGGVVDNFRDAQKYTGITSGHEDGSVQLVRSSDVSDLQSGTTAEGSRIIDRVPKPVATEYSVPATAEDPHRYLVEQALQRGEYVPDRVLTEYPELRGTVKAPSRRESAKATGKQSTSAVYREAYVDELRRMNTEADQASQENTEAGPSPELPPTPEVAEAVESEPAAPVEEIAAERPTAAFGPLALGMNPKVQEMGRKLANIAQTPAERDYLADLDRVATEAGEPGVKHDQDVRNAAMLRLETDPAKERANVIERAKKGEQLNDEDTLIAKQLFQDEAFEALRSGDETKLAEASAFRDAYRATGTEQARAFRQRHDPLGGKTVMEATPKERLGAMTDELFDRPPKERKARDKALRNGDTAEVEKLDKAHRARLKRIEAQLNSLGLSLEQLPDLAQDPIETAKVRNQIGAAKATFLDKLFEYRSSLGLFSGPATQIANIGGNAAHGLYDYAIQAPTEAVINTMMKAVGAGDPAGRHVGEFPHLWRGIQNGIAQGMRNAIITWKTEMPVTSAGEKYDKPRVAIGGKLGRYVRAPGYRLLGAADEFFNTLFANIEVGGAAFRTGKLKGLSGPELESHIHNEVTTPDSLSWRLALAHAGELTFHQELSGVPKKALDAAMAIRNVGPMRWFIPVISFPVKSAATALRKAPVSGDIAMMKAAYDNYHAGRPPAFGMSKRFAERALAWGVVMALASTMDDEEPWITGASSNPSGAPASSIKIGDQWLSYARIEPFATILGMTVDGIMVGKGGSGDKITSAAFDIPSKQIASKTFLQGLSDFMTLMGFGQDAKNQKPLDRAARYSVRFGESFVPNFYRQFVRAGRTDRDETRIWGTSSSEKVAMAGRRIGENLLPIKYEAKIDPWGRTMPSGVSPFWSAPLTDFTYRLLSPAYQTPDQPTKGDKLIARWNANNPDDPKSLNPPLPYFTINGKRHSMTPEEYEEYQVTAGTIANKIVERIPDTEKPTEATMKRIETAIENGRKAARGKLLANWRKAHRPTPPAAPGPSSPPTLAQQAPP